MPTAQFRPVHPACTYEANTACTCSYLVELSLVREAFDELALLVDALAHNLPSGGLVFDPLGSRVVRDHGVGEALLAGLVPEERLSRENVTHVGHIS